MLHHVLKTGQSAPHPPANDLSFGVLIVILQYLLLNGT